MGAAAKLLAFVRRRPVGIVLSLALTLLLGALLVATIHFTLFDLQWLAFLGGVLFAAVLSMASQASKAEWLIVRRTRQLERLREQLAEESNRSKTAAEALRAAELRMRVVGDALPVPMLYVDRDLRCRQHNHAWRTLTGLAQQQIEGQPLRETTGSAYPLMAPFLEQSLAGSAVDYQLAWPVQGNAPLKYTARHQPYPPDSAQPLGFYVVLMPAARQEMTASPVATTGSGASDSGDGETLYLQSIADELMGRDDPRDKLMRALRDNQFLLYAQKILPLRSGLAETGCHEILLRLQEEEDNLLPPGGFIPVAERYGMMEEIDRWVVHSLVSWCLARLQASPEWRVPMFCVNLSEAALGNPEFARFVRHELQRPGFPARALCFEIGEPEIISDPARAGHFISALKPAGCRFTVDAFGSVKVSFAHLRGLAVDFLKIDGVIIQNILRNPAELAKLQAIAAVCRKIGVRTIAEFVENGETLHKLRELGIDYAQGFGIARPAPIAELA
jgi:EAL domain-containing protein (putative c-di-GMP-specific phosphodiesterase class I)/PAS domain-containing protein